MKFGVRLRLGILCAALLLMGALIVLVTFNSNRQASQIRSKLDQVDAESFGLSEHFRELLRDTSDKLSHYRTAKDDASWKDYLRASDDFDAWIKFQGSMASTPSERAALTNLESTFTQFKKDTLALKTKMLDPALDDQVIDEMTQERRHLFDVGQKLSQAHMEKKKQLLEEAHGILTKIQLTALGALAFLFLFGIALAAFVYRDMIAPLQNQLVASQALVEQSEKLASLGLLAAGVAHEIRNPLTAIKAALFTQQKKFQPGTNEHGDVMIVEREILRLEKIVSDFLKFARPAEPELNTIATDLLLLDAKTSMEPQLSKSDIQLILEPGVPIHVKVDAAQIKQVLINLVQNAADSIGSDGTITLRSLHTRSTFVDGEKNAVILQVADTGKGIAPDIQKRLFDPFFTTKESGTGLGLSIAARIVQKNGGLLKFQTQVNYGSTFGIILPEANE